MNKFFTLCFLFFFANAGLATAVKPIDDAIDKTVSELIKRTKKQGKFAIKILPSKEAPISESTGIQIETMVAASIQKQSNFDSEIVPRASISAIWNEKLLTDTKERTDFGDFISKVKADYLVLILLVPTESNAMFSLQVFSVHGASDGKLIYSSPVSEVTVPSLNSRLKDSEIAQELKSISAQITAISKTGGIIEVPKSYSDHYHNSRIYSQRGEIDSAIKSYEELIKSRVQFADTIYDFVAVLKRLYGQDGANIFIEKKIKDTAPKATYLFAKQLLTEKPLTEIWQEVPIDTFPPLHGLFLKKCESDMNDVQNQNMKTTKNCRYSLMLEQTNDEKIFRIGEITKNGEMLQYFIDPIRAESVTEGLVFTVENHFSTMRGYIKYGVMKRQEPPAKYCGSMESAFCK